MKIFTENLNYKYSSYNLHFSFPLECADTSDFKIGYGEHTHNNKCTYFIAIDSYNIEHPNLNEGVNARLKCFLNNNTSKVFYGELAKKWNENGNTITEFIFLIGEDFSVFDDNPIESYELIIPDIYYEENQLNENLEMDGWLMKRTIRQIKDFSEENQTIRNDLWSFGL